MKKNKKIPDPMVSKATGEITSFEPMLEINERIKDALKEVVYRKLEEQKMKLAVQGFQTQYNRHPVRPEINNLPSETVPDQSMSVKEIMERYAKGLPISGQRVPIYEGDSEFPDIKHMDLAEIQELQEKTADELLAIKDKHNRYKERQAVINKEKDDRRLKELMEERRKYRRQNDDKPVKDYGQEDERSTNIP